MKRYHRQRHRVLQVVTKLLIPFVLMFALYVQFHGDYGPGGGFQAGVIFAAAFILHGLIFGLQRTRQVMPPGVVRVLMAGGVLIYAGTGVASMMLGGNLLDYDVLAHDPLHGQHWGLFAVELGVGVTVSGVMISLFYAFASQRAEAKVELAEVAGGASADGTSARGTSSRGAPAGGASEGDAAAGGASAAVGDAAS